VISISDRETFDRGLRVLAAWSIVLGIAAFAGMYSLGHRWLALAISGALLLGSIVVLRGDLPDRAGHHAWIPFAWVALLLSSSYKSGLANPLDPSSSAQSPDTWVQLLVYAGVFILVLHSRRLVLAHDRLHVRKGLLLAWPALAVASTMWSTDPLFTIVRALQLWVPIALAVLMAQIWLAEPRVAAELWRATFRLFVKAVSILVLLGFATMGSWETSRFTWPGAHPITAATYAALAMLVLLAYGRRSLQLRTGGYILRLLLLGAALYLGDTRQALGGLAVGVAVLLWFAGRRKPISRYLGLLYYGIGLLLILLVALPATLTYLERGGGSEGLMGLNGRVDLWKVSVGLLSDAGKWITGFGYATARVMLPLRVSWAGGAHSSWVEWLLGLGIPGAVLAAADIVFLFRYLPSRRSPASPATTLSLLAFLVVVSVVQETLAVPGLGFGMLVLLHVPVLAMLSSSRALDDELGFVSSGRVQQTLAVANRPRTPGGS
jgi:hypothetical protein